MRIIPRPSHFSDKETEASRRRRLPKIIEEMTSKPSGHWSALLRENRLHCVPIGRKGVLLGLWNQTESRFGSQHVTD